LVTMEMLKYTVLQYQHTVAEDIVHQRHHMVKYTTLPYHCTVAVEDMMFLHYHTEDMAALYQHSKDITLQQRLLTVTEDIVPRYQ